MINVACALWAPNKNSLFYSTHYTESDVEKLYRGFRRNLSVPFRFICWTDTPRSFSEPIEQRQIAGVPNYGTMIQPFEMNEPMIIVGLDTIIVGNCDKLAAYCIGADKLAIPRDPFYPENVCNGVVLAPAGHAWVWSDKPAEMNDMAWMQSIYNDGKAVLIDDLFPDQVVSYKRHVRKQGLGADVRICYFHGQLKPHELQHIGWIDRHWNGDDERSQERRVHSEPESSHAT